MTTKVQAAERQEAIDRLLTYIKPGDTIYCILRHTARSGMSRVIDLYKLEGNPDDQGRIFALWIGGLAAKAVEMKYDLDHGGIRIGGVGMDMGFALVYDLSAVLFADGYTCIGEGCPANDHVNPQYDISQAGTTIGPPPERDGKMHHPDGGYALTHRWL